MSERNNQKFITGLEQLGITLSKHQLDQFETYYDMLIQANEVMNLTAITEYDEVLTKHFIDSLSIVKGIILNEKNYKVLDLGTGAGFPGVPLKIAFPKLKITLMDSLNKRVNFLNSVIDKLKLTDIEAIHGRAEEEARKASYREKYDLCVSRAVAKLCSLAEFCVPFVKKNGYFISYKSGKVEEELQEASFAIHELGGQFEKNEHFILPDSDMERSLIFIKKMNKTAEKYPRAGGKPLNQPLLSQRKAINKQ